MDILALILMYLRRGEPEMAEILAEALEYALILEFPDYRKEAA